jgi:hypothetical protein
MFQNNQLKDVFRFFGLLRCDRGEAGESNSDGVKRMLRKKEVAIFEEHYGCPIYPESETLLPGSFCCKE